MTKESGRVVQGRAFLIAQYITRELLFRTE